MTKQRRNPTYIRTPRATQRMRRIVTGLILGGSVVVASAIVLSVPEDEVRAETPAEVQAEPERPAWAQKFEAAPSAPATPTATVELDGPVIESTVALQAGATTDAPKITIAIAHEDTKTDFAAAANEHLDEGDMQAALTAMRMHIHAAEATQDELLQIGSLARQVREHEIAEAALLEASSMEPARAEIHVELARTYLAMKELLAAQTEAREAIEIDRDSPAAWNAYGRISMAQSEWQQAELALRHALELDPTHPMYHNNAGLLYIYMKRGGDAVDALETSVELFEDDAPHFVFNNLGLAHEMAGNYEESREAFEEALLLNPFYSRAKVNLQRVEATLAKLEADSAFQTAQGASVAQSDGT